MTPTPFTAALAGAFSAWALHAFSRMAGSGSDVSVTYVLAFLLLVALPAHLGVLGLRRSQGSPSGGVDKPLLVRVAAWLVSAAIVSGITLAAT